MSSWTWMRWKCYGNFNYFHFVRLDIIDFPHIFQLLFLFYFCCAIPYSMLNFTLFENTIFRNWARARTCTIYISLRMIFSMDILLMFFFSSYFFLFVPENIQTALVLLLLSLLLRLLFPLYVFYHLYAFRFDSSWLLNCSNVMLPIFGYIYIYYMDNIHIFPNIIPDPTVYRYHINILLFRVTFIIDWLSLDLHMLNVRKYVLKNPDYYSIFNRVKGESYEKNSKCKFWMQRNCTQLSQTMQIHSFARK